MTIYLLFNWVKLTICVRVLVSNQASSEDC